MSARPIATVFRFRPGTLSALRAGLFLPSGLGLHVFGENLWGLGMLLVSLPCAAGQFSMRPPLQWVADSR